MSANIEIKARVEGLDAVRARARALATEWVGADAQTDTYFVTREGRLKLRESSLSGGQLIPYRRPDEDGPRRSDYQVIPIEDPPALRTLLSELLGVHRVVRKSREIALVDNVRIHLDTVDGLGTFVELEAVFDGSDAQEAEERTKVDRLMAELGLEPDSLIEGSYEGLVDPTA